MSDPLERQKRNEASPTSEVGSEGGSPGDLETIRRDDIGTGSEADETLRPADRGAETIVRDERGEGRRSP